MLSCFCPSPLPGWQWVCRLSCCPQAVTRCPAGALPFHRQPSEAVFWGAHGWGGLHQPCALQGQQGWQPVALLDGSTDCSCVLPSAASVSGHPPVMVPWVMLSPCQPSPKQLVLNTWMRRQQRRPGGRGALERGPHHGGAAAGDHPGTSWDQLCFMVSLMILA